jgi:hypothetical protein
VWVTLQLLDLYHQLVVEVAVNVLLVGLTADLVVEEEEIVVEQVMEIHPLLVHLKVIMVLVVVQVVLLAVVAEVEQVQQEQQVWVMETIQQVWVEQEHMLQLHLLVQHLQVMENQDLYLVLCILLAVVVVELDVFHQIIL